MNKFVAIGLGLALSGCEPAPNSAPAGTEAAAGTLTLEKFKRVHTGMAYKDVVGILGFEGTEQSSTDLAGTKSVMFAWANPDGMSNMNAMFQNDKLVTKAQFGLR